MSAPTYIIDAGWLCEQVDGHTCGTGPDGYYGAHEPGCGLVPIALVEDLLRAGAASTDEYGVRYVDTSSPTMSGPPTVVSSVGPSRERAEQVAGWAHGSWRAREMTVVRRTVTPWEPVTSVR